MRSDWLDIDAPQVLQGPGRWPLCDRLQRVGPVLDPVIAYGELGRDYLRGLA
jgi:hypothetical protein